jgi:glycerol-3-phosphate dehydrogenase (NAD(P)+)
MLLSSPDEGDAMYIQVVGAGSWGLALARVLALNGHRVRLWCRAEDGPEQLRATRESPVYLPGVKLPDSIEVVCEDDPSVDIAVMAVPSHVMRAAVPAHTFSEKTIRVSVAKGIENESLKRMSEVIREVGETNRVVVLSGPSHAEEVGRDLPCTVCVASENMDYAATVQQAFMNKNFRVYTTTDVVGVELGGSLKNVIAIAAGVCDGLALGDNARSALITRGLAEISRLGVAMGADPLTFMGLSGMGDLITTCTSTHSRNHNVGARIAKGMTPEQAIAASPMVAEGVRTSKSVHVLSRKQGVEMPISEQVYRVLFEGANPREAIVALMTREAKTELG